MSHKCHILYKISLYRPTKSENGTGCSLDCWTYSLFFSDHFSSEALFLWSKMEILRIIFKLALWNAYCIFIYLSVLGHKELIFSEKNGHMLYPCYVRIKWKRVPQLRQCSCCRVLSLTWHLFWCPVNRHVFPVEKVESCTVIFPFSLASKLLCLVCYIRNSHHLNLSSAAIITRMVHFSLNWRNYIAHV